MINLLQSKCPDTEQETAEDGMAGLQNKFQYFNKIWRTDRGHHEFISRDSFAIKPKQEAQRATYRTPEYNVPPF